MENIIEAITASATVILAVITGIYAWLTRKILKESERVRLDAQKPKIAIYPREKYEKLKRTDEAQSVYLCVENVSMAPAYDVNLELLDPSFELPSHSSEVRLLKDIPIIESGIGYLPPRHERSNRLSNANEYSAHDELMQRHTQIKVTYRDCRNKPYDDSICFDFRAPASQ